MNNQNLENSAYINFIKDLNRILVDFEIDQLNIT